MAILLTGLGYIGSRLATDLLARGERVVAVENFFCTARRDLTGLLGQPGIELVAGSINSVRTWRKVHQRGPFSALVHLAAQPSAHPAAASAGYTELTNLVGARLALEAALEAGNIEPVVLGSSFKVYGDELPPQVSERQPYGPVGDLAHLSKIYVEKLAEMLSQRRGLRCVAVRLGITYGLGPVKTDPRFMTVPNLFCKLAAGGDPLTVHVGATAPAGFIHVVDASRALQAGLELPLTKPYVAVNAVTECLTVGEVAHLVCQAARARGLATTVMGSRTTATGPPRVDSSLKELTDSPRTMASSLGAVLDFFLAQR